LAVGTGKDPKTEQNTGHSPDFILPDVVYIIDVGAENGKGVDFIQRDGPFVQARPVGV
jgi:hypothetical protein